jgi:Rrf2 family protein
MRLSTKATYGLRAMVDIALRFDKGATSIADIAEKEDISVDYLEQLLNRLRREGLLRSMRGPRGGYVLSREPGAITVRDVVKTLEGSMAPVYCITAGKDFKNVCRRSSSCVTKIVWAKLAKAIDECLESMTLNDLCVRAKRIEKRDS